MSSRAINTIFLCLLALASVSAQTHQSRKAGGRSFFSYPNAKFANRQQQGEKPIQTGNRTLVEKPRPIAPEDTMSVVLYRKVVKQYGWRRGLGKPITQEEANHLNEYYRFSQRNKAGHFTRVECLNGYGNYMGQGETYLLNPYASDDDGSNTEWVDKLKSIAVWEMVGDRTGEQCIQENAYDVDNKLIISFIPVRIGEDKYMGHYVDVFGLPASMRNDEGAKYVLIQWDKNGYEAEVSFIGDEGFPKKNTWNSYITKAVYDKEGFELSSMSCNVDGSYMRDRAGNSGQRKKYSKNGLLEVVTNYDENNQVLHIDKEEDDYTCERYERDEWGRAKRITYEDEKGKPDTTKYGVHGYEYQYNRYGKQTLIRYIGLDGKPINGPTGWCQKVYDYDSLGNMTKSEYRDADGRFWKSDDYYCLVEYIYDGEQQIDRKSYLTDEKCDTVLAFHRYKEGNTTYYVYPLSNRMTTYNYDDKGRFIEERFTDLDGAPIRSEGGYHRNTKEYKEKPGKCVVEELFYDINGKLMDVRDPKFVAYMRDEESTNMAYNRHIIIIDSINGTTTYQRFDKRKLRYQFQRLVGDNGEKKRSAKGLDIMGQQARSHYLNGLFYNSFTEYTIREDYAVGIYTNEYDEVSYGLSSDNDTPTIYAYSFNNEKEFDLDENGLPIITYSELRDSLPRSYVIEVYDSLGYKDFGIRSGDIIMRYGHWEYPKLTNDPAVEKELRQTMFQQRRRKKTMTVLRKNDSTGLPEVKEIALGTGMPGDFGFYFHRIFNTKREAERYNQAFSKIQKPESPKDPVKDSLRQARLIKKMEPVEFMRPYRSNGEFRNVYGQGIVDDAVVLGAVMIDLNGMGHMYQHTDSIDSLSLFLDAGNKYLQKLWVTTDLENVDSVELKGNKDWEASFWSNQVDKRISKPTDRLFAKSVKQEMENYLRLQTQAYKDTMRARYEKYGDIYRAVRENDSILLKRVEIDPAGYLAKRGLPAGREYIILEWDDWNCTDFYENFDVIADKTRDTDKHILLMRISRKKDDPNFYIYREPLDLNEKYGPLIGKIGINVGNYKISIKDFKNLILNHYKPRPTPAP